MKSILLGALALVSAAAAGPALAADLPVKSMAPPAPMYNWNGWYIGGNAGIAWATDTLTGYSGGPGTSPFFAAGGLPTTLAPGARGYLGGAQIGYNWQTSRSWLVGLEADLQGGNYKGISSVSSTVNLAPFTTSVEQHSDWFGTVRGRVGFLVAPNILLYGTGGFAYGQVESSQSTIANGFATCPATLPCASASATSTRYGWTAGGGWDVMFAPNWTVRAEWIYVDLGVQSLTATTPSFTPPVTFTSDNKFRDSILRIGFNYMFGGPVVAKY